MSMNLTKLAKKLVQDSRNRKKNTDRSAGFHQNQLASIGVFYLLTSFCPASLIIHHPCLQAIHAVVGAFLGEELFMASLLDDTPLVQHIDTVSVLDSG